MTRPMTNSALDADTQRELRLYAAAEGKRWKSRLQETSWWKGIPARDKHGEEYPHLYGLRNTHGPSWLADYRLPKQETEQ